MEPKLPTPSHGIELPSVAPPAAGETIGAFPGAEIRSGNAVEQRERTAETAPSAEMSAAPVPSLPVPVVTIPSDSGAATQMPQPLTSSPTVANDDELIEREWVDKAKKVITETRDDPYAREQRVSQLQADYLWKRYGRQLESPQ